MIKVIYASDIDRTLLFSEKYIEEYGLNLDKNELILGEVIDKHNRQTGLNGVTGTIEDNGDATVLRAYFSKKVYTGLNRVNQSKEIEFIPVTSRTDEEYKRVRLGFTPKYAITCNGGHILYNGKLWDEYIEHTDKIRAVNKIDLDAVRNEVEHWELNKTKPKVIGNAIVYFKLSTGEDKAKLNNYISSIVNKYEYLDVKVNRQKVYLECKVLNKGTALNWLRKHIESNQTAQAKVVASGDTVLDLAMLRVADIAIIPEGSELDKIGMWDKREHEHEHEHKFIPHMISKGYIANAEETIREVESLAKSD